MTDTPRVPDTRWSPTEGYWAASEGQTKGFVPLDVVDDFRAYAPADAVKLGDVEALRHSIADCERTYADLEREYVKACEREAKLRADIRAVVRKFESTDIAWSLMQEIPAVSDLIGDLGDTLDREPGREEPHCTCFVTPESQWTTHYGATEPGSMMEPNPECPKHFPRATREEEK